MKDNNFPIADATGICIDEYRRSIGTIWIRRDGGKAKGGEARATPTLLELPYVQYILHIKK